MRNEHLVFVCALMLLVGCTTTNRTIIEGPGQHQSNNNPLVDAPWEASIGLGQGDTDGSSGYMQNGTGVFIPGTLASHWNYWWAEATSYPWTIGGWRAGPTVHHEGYDGEADNGVTFEGKTVSLGASLQKNWEDGPLRHQSTLRFLMRTREDKAFTLPYAHSGGSGFNHWSEQRSLLFGLYGNHNQWYPDGIVREIYIWGAADFGLNESVRGYNANGFVPRALDPKRDNGFFRAGTILDLMQSPEQNFTVGTGFEYTSSQADKSKRLVLLGRVRVNKRWTVTPFFGSGHNSETSWGFSVSWNLWGN